jgi:hypothetical protein
MSVIDSNATKGLIHKHLGDVNFVYGEKSLCRGPADCCVFLKIVEDDDGLCYAGKITVPGFRIQGLRATPFQLRASVPSGEVDIVGFGSTGDGGAFVMPFIPELIGKKCRLVIDPPRLQGTVSLLTLRRNARQPVLSATSNVGGSSTELITVDDEYVTIRMPTVLAPYELVCVASSLAGSNHLIASGLMHLRTRLGEVLGKCRCDRGWLFANHDESKVIVDAWPVTTDPESRKHMTEEMLDSVSASDTAAAEKVRELRRDLESESGQMDNESDHISDNEDR